MRAVVKEAPRPGISMLDVPDPTPGVGELLIRVETAGICGSDLHAYEWIPEYSWLEPLLPAVLGHEITGTVVQAGSAADGAAVPVGSRVAVRPAVTCGSCVACQRGQSQRCIRRGRLGYEHPGGLAALVVAPTSNAYPIPDQVDEETASLIEPLTVALHAVNRVRVRPGATVGVVGAGAIGLLALQVLRAYGAGDVVLLGTPADDAGGGFAIGRRLGATADVAESAAVDPYRGACEVVLVAAGARAAIRSAVDLVAPGGAVVVVGLGIGAVDIDVDQLVRREWSLVGAFGSVPGDWLDALDLVAGGRVVGAGIVSHHYALGEAPEAFEALVQGRARKICIHPNRA
jgi:threonine dehydrogenase-like Zn-dependent dehydrogenase